VAPRDGIELVEADCEACDEIEDRREFDATFVVEVDTVGTADLDATPEGVSEPDANTAVEDADCEASALGDNMEDIDPDWLRGSDDDGDDEIMVEVDSWGDALAERVAKEDDDEVIVVSADALRVPLVDSDAQADAEDDITEEADVDADRVGSAADIVIVAVASSEATAENVRDSREDTERVGVPTLEPEKVMLAGAVNSGLNEVTADADTVIAADRDAESCCKDGDTREVLDIEPDPLADAETESESARKRDAEKSGDALAILLECEESVIADVRDAGLVAAADCDIEEVERPEADSSALPEAVVV
jgi:hypothetical protein